MIVIANKMDMPNSKENLKEFLKNVSCKVFEMSAINSDGIDDILVELANQLEKIKDEPLYEETEYLSIGKELPSVRELVFMILPFILLLAVILNYIKERKLILCQIYYLYQI